MYVVSVRLEAGMTLCREAERLSSGGLRALEEPLSAQRLKQELSR